MPLDHRLKVSNVSRSRRMLQVVHGAAVCHRCDQRSQLQRRHGNAFAEGAHLPYPAQLRGNLFLGINTRLLTLNVITGELAQSVTTGIVRDLLEPELAT